MPRRSVAQQPADGGPPPGPPPYPAWAHEVGEVERHFGTSLARGLSADRAAALHALHGFNELTKEPPKPLWKLVAEQFDDPLVKARPRRGGGHSLAPRGAPAPRADRRPRRTDSPLPRRDR